METLGKAALVGLGGFVGSALRYLVGLWIASRAAAGFPWHTLAVNVSGSFLLGLLTGLALGDERGNWRLLVGVGLLGGYTTYSTFALETVRLVEDKEMGAAVGYFFGTGALALLGAFLGVFVGRTVGKGSA